VNWSVSLPVAIRVFIVGLLLPACFGSAQSTASVAPEKIRVATFNTSLYRDAAGELTTELTTGTSRQARHLAAILQTVRPDIVLLNEIDYQRDHAAVKRFVEDYLAKPSETSTVQGVLQPLAYPYFFAAPVNTGVDSGLDLDGDGKQHGLGDNFGFGRYAGQYGMAILSRFPIDESQVRTFQNMKWSDLPDALVPIDPDTNQPYYSTTAWQALRLSSKSHWDVPIRIGERTLHLLASHPTPPAFDGPEDRNGCRNHDEIRFWLDYLDPHRGSGLQDDSGAMVGLPPGAMFVIAGDLNADPQDGSGRSAAIRQLLAADRVQDTAPRSAGAAAAGIRLGGKNATHCGEHALDTARFSPRGVGNLRVDYVLPSSNLDVLGSGVFWPLDDDPRAAWLTATDHRLVWADLRW